MVRIEKFPLGVHTVMYFYYLCAAFGPEVQKYLWWKKYITTIQLVQFVLVFFHALQPLFFECNFPRAASLMFAGNRNPTKMHKIHEHNIEERVSNILACCRCSTRKLTIIRKKRRQKGKILLRIFWRTSAMK